MVGTSPVLARRRGALPGRHLSRGVGAVPDADPAVPPRAQRRHHADADPAGRRRAAALAVRDGTPVRGDADRAARRARDASAADRRGAPSARRWRSRRGSGRPVSARAPQPPRPTRDDLPEDSGAAGRRAVRERVRAAAGIRGRGEAAGGSVRAARRDRGVQRRPGEPAVLRPRRGVARHPAARAAHRRRVRQHRPVRARARRQARRGRPAQGPRAARPRAGRSCASAPASSRSSGRTTCSCRRSGGAASISCIDAFRDIRGPLLVDAYLR